MGKLLELTTFQKKTRDENQTEVKGKIHKLVLNNHLGKLLQAAYLIPLITGIIATTLITVTAAIIYMIPFLTAVKTSTHIRNKIQQKREETQHQRLQKKLENKED